MKLEDIHEECKNCIFLRAFSVYMGGNGDYICRIKPLRSMDKNSHREPCDAFVRDENEVLL